MPSPGTSGRRERMSKRYLRLILRYGIYFGQAALGSRLENARWPLPLAHPRICDRYYYPENFTNMPALLQALEQEAVRLRGFRF